MKFSKIFLRIDKMSSVPCTSRCGPALLDAVKSIVPTLNHNMHKGNCGRIGIIGGSTEYTGAPYFAGISALKAGADLAHVVCPIEASTVIKSYSPELIVHPFLNANVSFNETSSLMDRLHSIVLGPGMGRGSEASSFFKKTLSLCMKNEKPIVIDADGLFFVCEDEKVVNGYKNIILTPNVVEFSRLYKKMFNEEPQENDPVEDLKKLCTSLGNVTIIRKGEKDIISNGYKAVICDLSSSSRRCGGQGDLLSGALATYFHWALTAYDKPERNQNKNIEGIGPTLIAAYAACLLTRECNHLAFETFGRSTVTTNMIDVIHLANKKLYD